MPKLCNFENCRNRAYYALTYGNPDRCRQHKEDRKGQYKVCKCGKALPVYNEPGETKPICCVKCKTDTMVDVIHKKCKCGTRPNFNEPGETKGICCKDCKTDTMVDVINKKCNCGKAQPSYNEPGETKGICCSNCKTDTMINVVSKKCKCDKIPVYNEPGETKGICCINCKTETMVNVESNKCKANDISMCDTTGNKKYKGYCTYCFQHLFPKDPLTFQIRSKTKEIAVRDFINENFDDFTHDKPLYTGHCDCSLRRRLDHFIQINNTTLVVETDENQHKSYDKTDEKNRYDDLYMAYSGKWIYIRFNPDKYKSKNGKNKNPELATRLRKLKKMIEQQMERIKNEENIDPLEIHYMYYDNYD